MLDQLPLWAVFIFTSLLIMASLEGGFRFGSSSALRGKPDHIASSGAMVQATLSLVAFMLAFTFGVAATRFNERRYLVIDEANAIGTSYLRANFLPEENKKQVQELFRQYVDLRLKSVDGAELKKQIADSEAVQDKLWDQTTIVGKAHMDSAIGALFVASMNDTLDLQSKRVAAVVYGRLPDVIWAALFAIMLLGLVSMGYLAGIIGARNWTSSAALVLSFAVVIMIIADLDRPVEGFLRVSKMPLKDLAKKIGPPTVRQEVPNR